MGLAAASELRLMSKRRHLDPLARAPPTRSHTNNSTTHQSRLVYVGPASTTSERQPERLTGRHIRFSSIALWSMQALSSQMRGCVSPSLRTPSVFAHSSNLAYLAAPSSDHECDTKPSTSPSFAARVLAWRPESVELARSAAVSALSGNARK